MANTSAIRIAVLALVPGIVDAKKLTLQKEEVESVEWLIVLFIQVPE